METKICKKCNLSKDLCHFSKDKKNKDGHNNFCKDCVKFYQIKNRERKKQYDILYNKINADKKKKQKKVYSIKNAIKLRNNNKLWREKNKDVLIEKRKQYVSHNKEKIKAYMYEYSKKYYKERRKNDALYKFRKNVGSLIYKAITRNGYNKKSRTSTILGCSFEDFKIYLESKFESWMTWDNYGKYNGEPNFGWDIDHIIPSSLGESENDVIILNNYTNLQPLCSYINRNVKKNKL